VCVCVCVCACTSTSSTNALDPSQNPERNRLRAHLKSLFNEYNEGCNAGKAISYDSSSIFTLYPSDGQPKTDKDLGTQDQLDARTTRTTYPPETEEMPLNSRMVVSTEGNCSVM
jgi:hypothetical protein